MDEKIHDIINIVPQQDLKNDFTELQELSDDQF